MTAHRYVLISLVIIFFLRFLVEDYGFIGSALNLLIEGVCFLCLLIVFIRIARGAKLYVSTKYLVIFVLFFASTAVGAVVNSVQPGAVLSGIRNTYMYMPFFLLPLVWRFSDEQFNQQLKLIILCAVVQIPVVVWQYMFGYSRGTMDHVVGTLMVGSYLSIFLVCCMSIAWGYYLRGQLSLRRFLFLCLIFLAPTTVNETKGTLLLIPMGFLIPALVLSVHRRNFTMLAMTMIIVVAMATLFMLLFSVFLSDMKNTNLMSFFLDGSFIDYLYSGLDENAPRDYGVLVDVGRIDAIMYAIKYITKDVVHFFFGYGVGNVSESASSLIAGDFDKYAHMAPQMTTLSYMLWEYGAFGVGLVLVGIWMIMKDSFRLAGSESRYAVFACGWAGVVGVYFLSLPYKNILISDVNGILFWYFSGIVVSEGCRLAQENSLEAAPSYGSKPSQWA